MGKVGTMFKVARTFGARDGLLRLNYELQCGSGLMSRRMRSVEGWEAWDFQRIASESSPEKFLNVRRKGAQSFFFSDCRHLAGEVGKIIGAHGKEQAVTEANKILAGNLPYFGRLSFASGFPPKWFQNPVTGQSVPSARSWTQMRFASDEYGDLKFILEPSRFLFVYPLARAYAVSGDERFPEAFWNAIEDWAANSSPMSGPLWICGQESSLRIMAWSFALYAFLGSSATTPQRAALLLSMIAAHAWRTTQTLGYARSQRSNHLISEAVGLWSAGTLFPELNEAAAWKQLGSKLLLEAVLDQITPQGAYLQDSFNYQRMVLQQLLWCIRLAEINQEHLDPEIRERTIAAFDFISQFVDNESGHVPNHGSNDGSYVLPLAGCDYGDFRPLMRMGSCVLNRQTSLASGVWDETAVWFCGASAESSSGESTCTQNAAAGYYRLGNKNSWALVRAGHYSRRPFQADQLHVDLWWHGLNLARDAGTYLYNGNPPWDNGLAGTAVHNTVMVDRHDQMRRAGRFLWLDWSQASARFCFSSSQNSAELPDRFEGEHDGYHRLGVKHRRIVQFVSEDAWVIVDDLLPIDIQNASKHELRLHWLLPDLPLAVAESSPFAAILSTDKLRIHWNIYSSAHGTTGVIRRGRNLLEDMVFKDKDEDEDEDAELLGWESPTYGELRPAISLLHHMHSQLPVRMVTVITASEEFKLSQNDGSLVLSRNSSEIYRVSLTTAQNGRISA